MVENVHKHLEHATRPEPQTEAGNYHRRLQQLGKPLFLPLVITVSFMPVFTLESQEEPDV